VSGSLSQVPAVPQRVFQSAVRNGLGHPLHGTLRLPPFYCIAAFFGKRETKIRTIQFVDHVADIDSSDSTHAGILPLLPAKQKVPDTLSPTSIANVAASSHSYDLNSPSAEGSGARRRRRLVERVYLPRAVNRSSTTMRTSKSCDTGFSARITETTVPSTPDLTPKLSPFL